MADYLALWLATPKQQLLGGGLLLGILLGASLQWSRLCLLRGLVQIRQGNSLQLKAFALAMAAALLSSQLVAGLTDIDLASSHYGQSSPALPVIFVGGLIFGWGMLLSNACTGRSLILLASGNLRSLVCLLSLTLGAGLTLTGLFAPLRVWLEDLTRLQLPFTSLPLGLGLLLAAGLVFYAVRNKEVWQNKPSFIGSLLVGALVGASWWLTGVVGFDEFEPSPLQAVSFVAPIFETQQYLVLFTGSRLTFSLVLVFGVFFGALTRALLVKEFVWQGFETQAQLKGSLSGGFLMGVGGVLALGCTYGQALSGFSTLAISSLISILGILLGARAGLAWRKN